MEIVCSSKRDRAFTSSPHTEFAMYIQKPHVISLKHLTEGTGASEAGLIHQTKQTSHHVKLTLQLYSWKPHWKWFTFCY